MSTAGSTRPHPGLQVAEELQAATAAAKCHPCGCFHVALEQLGEALPTLPEQAQESLRPVLAAGTRTVVPKEYDCLGCTECWPANALNLAAGAFPESSVATDASCPTEAPDRRRSWPPYPGSYHVLDAAGHIAVCTLTSESLMDRLAEAQPPGVAIVGTMSTENLGIERLLTNVLASPHITTVLVCGADSKQRVGHLPGQSLLSLGAHGVDERGRIIGARGRRPFLKNLSPSAIAGFRDEITLVDHLGNEDSEAVLAAIETLPGPRSRRRPVTDGRPAAVRAGHPDRLTLDPQGYFVLFPDRLRSVILVEHYRNDGSLAHVFEGERAAGLYARIVAERLVSRLDHAAYLGMELARAEHALRSGEAYVQDQAPEPGSPARPQRRPAQPPGSCGSACGCE